MQPIRNAPPFYFFFLVLPYGISTGFVTVTLPYLLTQNGFSVAQAATITSIGISANVWRFLWGPVADFTLSLKRWYWIGVIICMFTLFLLGSIEYNTKQSAFITLITFLSQVAATFVVLPLGGLMANRVADDQKGRAAGWYQAGNLGGVGFGGGAGLWLATHYNAKIAGSVLALSMIVFALVIILVSDVKRDQLNTLSLRLKTMVSDLIEMLKIPVVIFIMCLVLSPIGSGAAANVWSSIANDWKTDADTVALVTGTISGIISAIGCIAGGWIADNKGKWLAYLGSGLLMALVAIIMSIMPTTSSTYIFGVLAYAFAMGMCNAAFTAVILYAIGKKAASTKYSLLSSLGNIPVSYMTIVDGWAHDEYNSKIMLLTEAAAGILFVIIAFTFIRWMMRKQWVPSVVE